MELDYMQKTLELIQKINETQKDNILELARRIAENVDSGRIIHVFGTGHSHMAGMEMFSRAGGLANVNAILDPDSLMNFGSKRSGEAERLEGIADVIYDQYDIRKGDMIIITSNSGRNALPIEMAMRSMKEGVYTVVLTNLHQSKSITSRHSSGKKLYEFADLVIDTCVPDGDAMVEVGNVVSGPGSTIATVAILNAAVVEAIKLLHSEGKPMPVLMSQNVDAHSESDSEKLHKKYAGRIKHE